MRILAFSKKWDKLYLELPIEQRPIFTTFRFTRKDKDWQVGELAKVVYKPRQKGGGERLGIAQIIKKQKRALTLGIVGKLITDQEAKVDGFDDMEWMFHWLFKFYGERLLNEPMNKLTLRWVTIP